MSARAGETTEGEIGSWGEPEEKGEIEREARALITIGERARWGKAWGEAEKKVGRDW